MKNKKSHPPGEFGYALAPRQGRLRLGNSKSEEIFKDNKVRRKKKTKKIVFFFSSKIHKIKKRNRQTRVCVHRIYTWTVRRVFSPSNDTPPLV
jgi:hypothetical protein